MNKYILLIILTLVFNSSNLHAQITGPAFSYQGELIDNGSPANGNYDFQVFLYLTETGGTEITDEIFQGTQVVNGLFNLEINFGDVVYEDSDQYYIEIEVTPPGGVTAVLAPRTKLLAVPYATQALLGTSPWEVNATALTTPGNVGIGNVTSPTDQLHVSSDVGENALRVQVGAATKLRVLSNGGTVIGINGSAPSNGLHVNGDVTQNENSNGMLKYMLKVECDSTPTIYQQYNGTNVAGSATITQSSTGNCDITMPINMLDRYISATATQNNGQTINCSIFNPIPLNIICNLSTSSTGAGVNGVYHILVY